MNAVYNPNTLVNVNTPLLYINVYHAIPHLPECRSNVGYSLFGRDPVHSRNYNIIIRAARVLQRSFDIILYIITRATRGRRRVKRLGTVIVNFLNKIIS